LTITTRRGLSESSREKLNLYVKNLRKFWAQYRRSIGGMIGLGFLVVFVVMALTAPLLSTVKNPNSPDKEFRELNLQAGGWGSPAAIDINLINASYPRVAVDQLGNAIAVWEQADGVRSNISANRYIVGTGWGNSTLIENNDAGDAYNPQVAINQSGYAIAVWEQSDGTRSNISANRYIVGTGWGTPTLIEADSTGDAYNPQVAVDQSGYAIAVWEQSDGTHSNIWSNHYDVGTGWGTPTLIEADSTGDAYNPQIAVDQTGNAVVVWEEFNGSRSNISANRYDIGRGWGTSALIEIDDAGDAYNPQVAVNQTGYAVAVWEQSDGTRSNIWSNRYDVGTGWGTATLVETDNAGDARNPQVAFYQSSDAIAVWEQSDGTRSSIWANRHVGDTGWGDPLSVETDNAENAYSPQVAANYVGIAVVVWEQSDSTRSDIWANRYYALTGWGTSTLIETEDTGDASNPQVAVDPNGYSVAVWAQFNGTRNNITAGRDFGMGWENPHRPSFDPSPYSGLTHPLGTDFRGKDVYSMMLFGAIASLIVGLLASLISLLLGTGIGIASGYLGRGYDEILMRATDFFLVIPWFPLAIVISFILGASFWNVIMVIGIVSWPSTARIVRAQVLSVKERGFIQRARCVGASGSRIVGRHIMPNILPLIFANTVLLIANSIFMEAFLDFFGLGDPNVISWGLMLEEAYEYGGFSARYWWPILPPGLCIVALVMAFYLIGDAIDDIVNPKLRRR